ncbi:MAG: pilin [Candidatus Pacearchaeota archaeon]|nr:pilin [Candidatus Pacearchaeota archaeon]
MPQRKCQKAKAISLLSVLAFFLCMTFVQMTLVRADSGNETQYQQILQPVQNVYDFVKYAVTIIAGLLLIFAGYTFITSGNDPKKKEEAKNMVMYVIIGLAIIWAAPLIVKLILGT